MLPQEIGFLQFYGYSTLARLAQHITVVFLYGIFILLCCISVSQFLQKDLKSRAGWIMLSATIASFIIATVNVVAEVSVSVIGIWTPLYEASAQTGLPPAAILSLANDKLLKLNIVVGWMVNILPIISDAVVVWRAWVLFQEQRWVMTVPLLFLLASIVMALLWAAPLSSTSKIASALTNGSILAANIGLSMATNLVATLLIAYKLWTHRRFVVKNVGRNRQGFQAARVLLLLVESGAIYGAVQLVYFTLGFSPEASTSSTLKIILAVFTPIYFMLAAMYPTIVIFLVNTQRSMVETCGFGSVLEEEMVVAIPDIVNEDSATTGDLEMITMGNKAREPIS